MVLAERTVESWGPRLGTALRKTCDSSLTSVAWHWQHAVSASTWALWIQFLMEPDYSKCETTSDVISVLRGQVDDTFHVDKFVRRVERGEVGTLYPGVSSEECAVTVKVKGSVTHALSAMCLLYALFSDADWEAIVYMLTDGAEDEESK